ncbi:MAG: o-succinylbenzoate--CoA ligase [Bacteroidia bacterium]|nr:o-succinylbenzoate--CoA ligase [Bacteroidia bacterium]
MEGISNSQFDWASKWANYRAESIALIEHETNKKYSYFDLNRAGNYWAKKIKESFGLQKGDRLAILGENSAIQLVLFIAAQKSGIILVPMNWRLNPSEISYLLKDAQPKALVAQSHFMERLREKHESKEALAGISYKSTLEEIEKENGIMLASNHSEIFEAVEINENDPIFILYTSGTTGFPKGALYTHKMLFWNSINTALRLDLTSQDITINVMPLFHTGGWNVLLTPFLHRGACTVLMKSFDAQTVLSSLEENKISIFMGVPTMLKMMADQDSFEKADLSSLRYFVVGGEAMPLPLIERYHQKGTPIRQGYGMTEAGPNLTSLSHHDAISKKGSIGMPNFYVQTRIVSPQGMEVDPGEPGELLIKGPMVSPGYWRNEKATQKTIVDGWLHTGDMAVKDKDGFLFIVDRIKNMYISGGENVYPAEVERILRMHPSISEVAVVPMPDLKWGESGKAFITLKSPNSCSEDEVIVFCKEKLAKFKVPKQVVILDSLPKNGTGKIDRKKLQQIE